MTSRVVPNNPGSRQWEPAGSDGEGVLLRIFRSDGKGKIFW